mgnify:CR=1 FL=1
MLAMLCLLALGADTGTLRAGAVALDVTPGTFPVLVNGGMTWTTVKPSARLSLWIVV